MAVGDSRDLPSRSIGNQKQNVTGQDTKFHAGLFQTCIDCVDCAYVCFKHAQNLRMSELNPYYVTFLKHKKKIKGKT